MKAGVRCDVGVGYGRSVSERTKTQNGRELESFFCFSIFSFSRKLECEYSQQSNARQVCFMFYSLITIRRDLFYRRQQLFLCSRSIFTATPKHSS